jgi:hypothetical protein
MPLAFLAGDGDEITEYLMSFATEHLDRFQ